MTSCPFHPLILQLVSSVRVMLWHAPHVSHLHFCDKCFKPTLFHIAQELVLEDGCVIFNENIPLLHHEGANIGVVSIIDCFHEQQTSWWGEDKLSGNILEDSSPLE